MLRKREKGRERGKKSEAREMKTKRERNREKE